MFDNLIGAKIKSITGDSFIVEDKNGNEQHFERNGDSIMFVEKGVTIRDIYNWAKKNNAEDLEVVIQYRDEGGDYFGVDKEPRMSIGYYDGGFSDVTYNVDYSGGEDKKRVVVL